MTREKDGKRKQETKICAVVNGCQGIDFLSKACVLLTHYS